MNLATTITNKWYAPKVVKQCYIFIIVNCSYKLHIVIMRCMTMVMHSNEEPYGCQFILNNHVDT